MDGRRQSDIEHERFCDERHRSVEATQVETKQAISKLEVKIDKHTNLLTGTLITMVIALLAEIARIYMATVRP